MLWVFKKTEKPKRQSSMCNSKELARQYWVYQTEDEDKQKNKNKKAKTAKHTSHLPNYFK